MTKITITKNGISKDVDVGEQQVTPELVDDIGADMEAKGIFGQGKLNLNDAIKTQGISKMEIPAPEEPQIKQDTGNSTSFGGDVLSWVDQHTPESIQRLYNPSGMTSAGAYEKSMQIADDYNQKNLLSSFSDQTGSLHPNITKNVPIQLPADVDQNNPEIVKDYTDKAYAKYINDNFDTLAKGFVVIDPNTDEVKPLEKPKSITPDEVLKNFKEYYKASKGEEPKESDSVIGSVMQGFLPDETDSPIQKTIKLGLLPLMATGVAEMGVVAFAVDYGVGFGIQYAAQKAGVDPAQYLTEKLGLNATGADVLNLLEGIGLGHATTKIRKSPYVQAKANAFLESATKNVLEATNAPKSVFIDAEKVKSIFQTGEKISAEEQDLIRSLGLNADQYKDAIKNGVSIEIPTQKVVTITDKPYWAKVKGIFGIEPTSETRIFGTDKNSITPVKPIGLLPGKSVKPTIIPKSVVEEIVSGQKTPEEGVLEITQNQKIDVEDAKKALNTAVESQKTSETQPKQVETPVADTSIGTPTTKAQDFNFLQEMANDKIAKKDFETNYVDKIDKNTKQIEKFTKELQNSSEENKAFFQSKIDTLQYQNIKLFKDFENKHTQRLEDVFKIKKPTKTLKQKKLKDSMLLESDGDSVPPIMKGANSVAKYLVNVPAKTQQRLFSVVSKAFDLQKTMGDKFPSAMTQEKNEKVVRALIKSGISKEDAQFADNYITYHGSGFVENMDKFINGWDNPEVNGGVGKKIAKDTNVPSKKEKKTFATGGEKRTTKIKPADLKKLANEYSNFADFRTDVINNFEGGSDNLMKYIKDKGFGNLEQLYKSLKDNKKKDKVAEIDAKIADETKNGKGFISGVKLERLGKEKQKLLEQQSEIKEKDIKQQLSDILNKARINKEFVKDRFNNPQYLVIAGQKYNIGQMSYGDYFIEPFTVEKTERDDFNKNTLWSSMEKDRPLMQEIINKYNNKKPEVLVDEAEQKSLDLNKKLISLKDDKLMADAIYNTQMVYSMAKAGKRMGKLVSAGVGKGMEYQNQSYASTFPPNLDNGLRLKPLLEKALGYFEKFERPEKATRVQAVYDQMVKDTFLKYDSLLEKSKQEPVINNKYILDNPEKFLNKSNEWLWEYNVHKNAEGKLEDAIKFQLKGDTETAKKFKKWFGDSKVVDEKGNPLVVFHGTNSDEINIFDKKKIGNRDSGWFGKGFYFALTKGEASYYGKNIIPVFLKMDKPFVFSDYNDKDFGGYGFGDSFYLTNLASIDKRILGKLSAYIYDKPKTAENNYTQTGRSIKLDEYKKLVEDTKIDFTKEIYERQRGVNKDKVLEYTFKNLQGDNENFTVLYNGKEPNPQLLKHIIFDKVYGVDLSGGMYGVERKLASLGDEFTNILKEKGYDGTMQTPYGDEYVVFEPNQIKRADGTNSTFDPENPDIRLQQGKTNAKIITNEKVLEQIKKIPFLSQIKTEKVKEILTKDNQNAWGSYFNSVIKYVENPNANTLPHEAFHAFLDLVIPKGDKNKLFELARKQNKLLGKDATNLEVEEFLAEDFANYFNKKENNPTGFIKTIWEKIKKAFREIFQNKKTIEDYYEDVFKKKNKVGESTVAIEYFKEEVKKLSTVLLEDLKNREVVNKSYIEQRLVSSDLNLKQTEKDLVRTVLGEFGDKINVAEFTDAVLKELLPLKVADVKKSVKYENVSLPSNSRGNVKDYKENTYRSPIETSAGGVHFGNEKNYFGHTRIEDMADNQTRRVIEVQSDLYQKGNLEKEVQNRINESGLTDPRSYSKMMRENGYDEKQIKDWENKIPEYDKVVEKAKADVAKLQQYSNPTAHFRMVREEIAKAKEDGVEKLQFPTGKTAMKIEGLGQEENNWNTGTIAQDSGNKIYADEVNSKLVGEVLNNGNIDWVVTEVLPDGKFVAVDKFYVDNQPQNWEFKIDNSLKKEGGNQAWVAINKVNGKREFQEFTSGKSKEAFEFLQRKIGADNPEVSLGEIGSRHGETFDISGKVDTSNPIYRFYEKDLSKYLTSKHNAKLVTDPQGVTWNEIDITKEPEQPVFAFYREVADKEYQDYLRRFGGQELPPEPPKKAKNFPEKTGISKFQSRMQDLLDEQNKGNTEYTKVNKTIEVAKAEKFYEKDPSKFIEMYKKGEIPNAELTDNVAGLTILQKALEEGDNQTVADVLPILTLRATRAGQEIAMLRNAFGENDPISFLEDLAKAREDVARVNYKKFFAEKNLEVKEIIKRRVNKARKSTLTMADYMETRAKDIDDFLQAITC